MGRNRDLAKNTLLIGLSKIATQLLVFLLVPLYTKYLTPQSYGSVDLIMTYIALAVPFLTIQLEFAAFRYAIDNRQNEKKLSELISTIFSAILPLTAILVGIFLIVSTYIDIPYASLIALNVVTSVVLAVLLQFARGVGRTKVFAVASIVAGVTTVLVSFVSIILLHWDASSIILAVTISNSITSLYLSVALRLRDLVRLANVSRGALRPLLSYALPLVPNNLSWWILNVSDRTVIAMFIGAAANGVYGIAYRLAYIPSVIFGIFNMSWSETSAIHINAPDKDDYFSKVFNNTFVVYSCISLLLISFMPVVFPHFIGASFKEAYDYIPLLVLGGLAQAMVGMYSSIYIALKKTKEIAATSMYAAIINLVVNLALVSFIGVYASALSTFVAFLAMLIHRHFSVQRYVNINYDVKILIKIVPLFIATTYFYYMNSLALNITSIVITLVGVFLLSRNIVAPLISMGWKKLSTRKLHAS